MNRTPKIRHKEKIKIRSLGKADLPQVIKLSLSVFRPKTELDLTYHRLEKWQNRLSRKGLLLGSFKKEELVGFFARL